MMMVSEGLSPTYSNNGLLTVAGLLGQTQTVPMTHQEILCSGN